MYNEAVCQVTTLMTLLNGCLLKSVTDNSTLPPVHYERIFMYCMAWGLGGLLDVKDRPALDAELRNMCDALPKKVSPCCHRRYSISLSCLAAYQAALSYQPLRMLLHPALHAGNYRTCIAEQPV